MLRDEGPVRWLKNRDGRVGGNSEEVCVLPSSSHFIEIPNDCLISSYNALLRRNMQLENTVQNAKKEVRVLRLQLDESHKMSTQPLVANIMAYPLDEDEIDNVNFTLE